MPAAFVAGALAGYAIAIPVGAIAILIMEVGIRRGFRAAAAAGAGTASADGLYATLATAGGTAFASLLEPFTRPLRIIAVGALLGIGLRGFYVLVAHRRRTVRETGLPVRHLNTYLRFLALTLLNPATVIYFAALILGLPSIGRGPGERAAFVAGAFLASLSWQTTLAAIGTIAHHRLSPRFQLAISLLGNGVIVGFAVVLASRL